MEFIELEKDNLDNTLENNKRVIVQYGAGWCGNCRLTKPKFKRLSGENEDIQFVYADAEKFPGSRKFAQVDNLPTFAGFVDGKLIKQNQGNKQEIIEDIINSIKTT